MDDYTDDDFLDGKLILRQPKKGYRAGSDALLLAAALPLCQGKMLEVGAGVGAPSLCYLARVGVELATKITALEKFKNVAKLAQYNVD